MSTANEFDLKNQKIFCTKVPSPTAVSIKEGAEAAATTSASEIEIPVVRLQENTWLALTNIIF